MAHSDHIGAEQARLALAAIRILNGSLALLTPRVLIRRVEAADPPSAAAIYAFRMFGIRTVLLGADLIRDPGAARAQAIAEAPLIHASDTISATVLTLTRRVSLRHGLPLIGISALNTALAALVARDTRRTSGSRARD